MDYRLQSDGGRPRLSCDEQSHSCWVPDDGKCVGTNVSRLRSLIHSDPPLNAGRESDKNVTLPTVFAEAPAELRPTMPLRPNVFLPLGGEAQHQLSDCTVLRRDASCPSVGPSNFALSLARRA